jgi:hypothetical protein
LVGVVTSAHCVRSLPMAAVPSTGAAVSSHQVQHHGAPTSGVATGSTATAARPGIVNHPTPKITSELIQKVSLFLYSPHQQRCITQGDGNNSIWMRINC